MKKGLLTLAILMTPFVVQAQKITEDKVITGLNKRIMKTSWERVNWASDGYKLEVSMMLEGRDVSILLNWQCKEMVGAERDAKITLYFDDQSTTVLLNKSFSVSGAGKVISEDIAASTMGIQLDGIGDIEAIASKTLTAISMETTSGDINIPVTLKESLAVQKLYNVFEQRRNKYREI